MSARDNILGRIRHGVAKGGQAAREAAVTSRLDAHRGNLVPGRGQGDGEHRIALFRKMMEAVGATVEVLGDVNEVPGRVAEFLLVAGLPARLRRGADPWLAGLPWQRHAIEAQEGRAVEGDTASLTLAFAGIAESGTIVQVSGPDSPTTLNFLPEVHIVVLEAARLVGCDEEVWPRLRARCGPGLMPRTVNMISGPSRTTDIEQTIVRPAHGPKNLHILIVS
jgi:L-lactate dehydrogenase complex protein LldG